MNIYTNIIKSFTTDKGGFSARKLSAFSIIVVVIIGHIKWFKSEHWEYWPVVLGADFGFILACLGLTTLEKFKGTKADNGENSQKE